MLGNFTGVGVPTPEVSCITSTPRVCPGSFSPVWTPPRPYVSFSSHSDPASRVCPGSFSPVWTPPGPYLSFSFHSDPAPPTQISTPKEVREEGRDSRSVARPRFSSLLSGR